MQRTVLILTIVEKSYIRIIPARFGQNPASSFEAIVDEGRHTMDDVHPMISIAHLEPLAQVS